MLALIEFVSWRAALGLVALACLGVVTLLVSQLHVTRDHRTVARTTPRSTGFGGDLRLLMAGPIVAALAYFALLAMAQSGLQTFSVVALAHIYAAPLDLAGGALTGYLLGIAAGILAGGFLADLIPRHGTVASVGLGLSALFTLLAGSGALSLALLLPVMACAGFSMGVTSPSRDMLVRATVPASASGKVYGFVYSGLDLGSLLAPMVFGWMLDHDRPRALFGGVAVLLLVTILTVVQVRAARFPGRRASEELLRSCRHGGAAAQEGPGRTANRARGQGGGLWRLVAEQQLHVCRRIIRSAHRSSVRGHDTGRPGDPHLTTGIGEALR
jgi:FSR family fosmidomycin resistance protein-like MFS transporter